MKSVETVFGNTDTKVTSFLPVSKKDARLVFLSGCVIGTLLFIILYGVKILEFTYVDWIYAQYGDIFQNQLGFMFFRDDVWRFPLGSFKNYCYPFGSSVVYTDSIPLFAVLFKLVRFLLPKSFQYLGLWGILCFSLQGGVSCLILRRFSAKMPAIFIGSIFVIYSTNAVMRMFYHCALGAQWIILLPILFWCYREYIKRLKTSAILWSLLAVVAISIQAYLAAMVFIMMGGFLMADYLEYKSLKRVTAVFCPAFAAAVFVFWALGGFMVQNVTREGLGWYSMNLNALYNPLGWSSFIKNLPAFYEQYEGFQYLGLGIIVMIPFVIFRLFSNPKSFRFDRMHIPVILVATVFLILALSPVITFNDKELFSYYDSLKPVLNIASVFRVSGRFFWPVYYILIFYLIIKMTHLVKKQVMATIILISCLAVQLADISPKLKEIMRFYRQDVVYSERFQSGFWDEARKHFKHIESLTYDDGTDRLGLFAAENHLTLNNGYFSRKDTDKIRARIDRIANDILWDSDRARDDTLYIIDPKSFNFGEMKDPQDYSIIDADGYSILIKRNDTAPIQINNSLLVNNTVELPPKEFHQTNCVDRDGKRIIKSGGISFGPYKPILKGEYEVTLKGENLDLADIDVCYGQGSHILPVNIKVKNSSFIKYTFTTDFEFDMDYRIFNR